MRLLVYLSLILCTCVPALLLAQDELTVPSTIDHATVYLAGAQVQRSGQADLPEGRTMLVFKGLTSTLDPASVQVTADADGLLILSVSHRLHFPEVDTSAAQDDIYARIDRLEDRRRHLLTEVEIAKEEEALLRENRKLGGEDQGLSAADLAAGVRFHRERITAIKRSYLVLRDSLRTNADRREALQRQLAERAQDTRVPATSEVIVIVEAERAVRSPLTLTYLVADASWTPQYDVRVEATDEPLDLQYHASVRQSSGEDWTDVQLSLSTGDPSESAVVPVLQTWRLREGQLPPTYETVLPKGNAVAIRQVTGTVTDEEGVSMIGASVRVVGTTIGTATDIDGQFQLELPDEASALVINYTGFDEQTIPITSETLTITLLEATTMLDEVVVTAYGIQGRAAGINIDNSNIKRQRPNNPFPSAPVPTQTQRRATTVTFAIELPYSIPSDGKARRVEIQRYAIPAAYQHIAVPKRTEDVYLSATIRDWEQYDLISGDLQLFFEGTYLGTSRLDVDKTADSLSISLGRDAGVIVSREPNQEYRQRSGLFGGKQVASRGWTISVRNTKTQPIRLTLLDQVPVSAQGNIDVETDLAGSGRLDEETGEISWQLDLPAGTERKVTFGYSVRYGGYERVYLE
ncbi:hypothetical protein LEM8419_03021 [Neolewinella maritima]|uniref:Mucoidy inhibitor MuiA family protein n=1 Tax=Neolewinella maritima TaxID=1383882 RepID=A0ABM9B4L2_9BACT|nr:DUF4139 domain-containing protein [Neolewinella maritima]CAH1002104.1 hypothetical protein LEM8419_03021 [Neolewinella maritima]